MTAHLDETHDLPGPEPITFTEAQLSIFIPEHLAARCNDCGGVFLIPARKCNGCGSVHWECVQKATKEPAP